MNNVNEVFMRLLPGVLAVSICFSAIGAEKASKEQAASQAQARRMQQQLRAVEQEKAQLAQQKSEAESQAKDAQGRAQAAQRRATAAADRNNALSRELDALKGELAALRRENEALIQSHKGELGGLNARVTDMARMLSEQRLAFIAEKQQIEGVLAASRKESETCGQRNDRMYQLGVELLEKYEKKSCFTSLLQAEPFTQLKRAQIEKMIEEERERLDKDRLVLPRDSSGTQRPKQDE